MGKIINTTDYLQSIVNNISREVFNYTPQLYLKKKGQDENIDVQAIASGVLITADRRYFLLTAGHVIEGRDPEDLGILVGNTFNILNGNIKYVNPYFDSVSFKTDIAIWELDENVAQSLTPTYNFLSLNQIDLHHSPLIKPQYLIVGYPWKKSKANPIKRKIKVRPFVFLTKQSQPDVYKKIKHEFHSNLILEYKQRQIKEFGSGIVKKGVNPEGISGCGVWFIPKFISTESVPEFKLVGIIIGQDQIKRNIISTRIHLVTEVLRIQFGLNIPASSITRIDIDNMS
ncbi:MAG: hypothetical protein RLN88_10900 [Ekhidna sp.]|uniref:hypothetical protein n=1 Tax=Ekhidna sp. TaxID=2608089 RepID=UPI0032EDC4AE